MKIYKFLPLGTIVKLELNDCKIMIVGYRMKNNIGYVYDYCGCRYPEGIVSKNDIYYFNRDKILEVLKLGYMGENINIKLEKIYEDKLKKKDLINE